jgi:hypothetical protein
MDGGSYRQPFEVTTAILPGPTTALAIDGTALATGDFVPLAFSAEKPLEGKTIAVGYGISAPELGVDDYKGKQVKGKIAVVRRFVPEGKAFDSDTARRTYGDLQYKAFAARQHGAIGVIIIDAPIVSGKPAKSAGATAGSAASAGAAAGKDARPAAPPEAELPGLLATSRGGAPGGGDAGVVAFAVKRDAGEKLLSGSHSVRGAVALDRVRDPVFNVVGKVAAGAPPAARLPGVVVIGAHYDHLGQGGPSALDTEPGIHNGADDNASGTAALLEVARTLQARRSELRRDVYIVAFTAEESGVLGSSHFVRSPPPGLAIADVLAMLNMDMVGRLRMNQLTVLGGESADEWQGVVGPACDAERIRCSLSGSGYGPSDHMPFYSAGVPVLHFFSGGHLDYHKTTDDTAAINAAGGARIAAVVADVALSVAARDTRLSYKKVAPPPQGGDLRAMGASLGTIPTYDEETTAQPGVLLSDVVPDGAAAKAGLKAGDRIIMIGTIEVRNVHDLMFVLGQARPGDRTQITFLRGGARKTVDAVFGRPRARH